MYEGKAACCVAVFSIQRQLYITALSPYFRRGESQVPSAGGGSGDISIKLSALLSVVALLAYVSAQHNSGSPLRHHKMSYCLSLLWQITCDEGNTRRVPLRIDDDPIPLTG
ncbi:hypothetical protein J6590_027039 [Homalodisca vitripennis]|nr:hypothetical protein J6590_027039 [Homalodisca vitripennis]